MKWVALSTWIATAAGGLILFNAWVSGGGMERRRAGGIRPWLVLTHLALAVLGLLVYVLYVVVDDQGLNWLALLFLLPTAALGWWMFALWFRRVRRAKASPAAAGDDTDRPEGFPVPVVAGHGVLAVTTVILVFIEAGLGES
jgi:hypothetical protein